MKTHGGSHPSTIGYSGVESIWAGFSKENDRRKEGRLKLYSKTLRKNMLIPLAFKCKGVDVSIGDVHQSIVSCLQLISSLYGNIQSHETQEHLNL